MNQNSISPWEYPDDSDTCHFPFPHQKVANKITDYFSARNHSPF